MKKVILDMDPGIDDALALILACRSPEIRVEAVTAVSGNVSVDKALENALRILDFIRAKLPVAKGMANPLLRDPTDASRIHGTDGLGGVKLPPPTQKPDGRHAIDLLLQTLGSAKRREFTVIATGPLTNIAAAVTKDLDMFRRGIDSLVIMGGAYGLTPYGIGNQTPVSEYNMYVDPEAAEIVFDSGLMITAVGLDVVMDPKAVMNPKQYVQVSCLQTITGQLFRSMTRRLYTRFGRIELPDPMAIAYAVAPALFKLQESHVQVETAGRLTRGQTIVDRREGLSKAGRKVPNAKVAIAVDGRGFLKLFVDRVLRK